MNRENRTAIVGWLLGILLLIATVWQWGGAFRGEQVGLPTLISLIVLLALVKNLSVRTTFGTLTFSPVVALMSYFLLGIQGALAIVVLGHLAGGIVQVYRGLREPGHQTSWWVLAGYEMGVLGGFIASLLAAHWAYLALDGQIPLLMIHTERAALPVIAGAVVFLLVANLLLAGGLLLRGVNVLQAMVANRQIMLGLQLLPVPLAPFGALLYATLGFYGLLFLEAMLAAIAVAVSMLVTAQSTLQHQVNRLRALSGLNDALRSTLELENLLDIVSRQVGAMLNIENIQIVLYDQSGGPEGWYVARTVSGGQTIPDQEHLSLNNLVRHVLATRQPLGADPLRQATELYGVRGELPALRAWLGVPLIASGRLLGALTVWLYPGEQLGRALNAGDLDLLAGVAAQAGLAFQNALLYDTARQNNAQLQRLNHISSMLNASQNPERLLEMIANAIIDVGSTDKAAIYLLETDVEDPRLILAQARGFTQQYLMRARDIAVPLTNAERASILEQARAVVVPDINATGMEVSAAARLFAREENFRAYAYLPLQAQQQVIGMLAVYYDHAHYFTQREVEMLETFANQAALAVTNARVYQAVDIQLSRRVGQIVRMADISQRLSATLDLETIFSLIIDSALEGCSADAGMLVLSEDPESGKRDAAGYNMVAWRGLDPSSTSRAPHLIVQRLANSRIFETGESILYSGDDPAMAGPSSHLSVPIFLDNRVIGAIVLESDILNAFNEEDLAFVSQLAVQAAVAIRNAQLFRHAQSVRDRLTAILDSTHDGLLMIDTKSRIVMTNTAMSDFWDFARQDFRPRSPDQFMADPLSALGEGLGYREGELNQLLNRGVRNPNFPPQTDVYATRSSASPQRFVERTVSPVREEQGNFIGLLLIFRDVTQQKELELARQNLTELIVHDLRAPLQAVMGGMRLIEQVVGHTDAVVTQALDVGGRAVKKLLTMVNDLLDLSRMERGEVRVDATIEGLRPIMEDAAEELRPLAQEVDAVLKVEVPDGLPPVMIDRDMIERVVLNLVDNALKYSPPGTMIRLRASVAQAGSDPVDEAGQMLRIEVIDQGPGVPDDYKQKIWDRFATVPGLKGRRPSAGLGLAFCRLAIESHGGRAWVEDNPEGGSIFAFTLPIAYQAEEEVEE